MASPTGISEIPKKPAQRAAWVVFQLRMRGLSLSELARREGVTRRGMAAALYYPSAQLEPVIASAIGITVEQLFPERFSEDGTRLHRVIGEHPNRGQTRRQSPKAAAG
jgi:Ner family transcriptional regulator